MTTIINGTDTPDFRAKRIIAEKLGLEDPVLLNSMHFKDDLGIDSLDMLELQMELEKEFHVSIPDEDAEKLTTVGALLNYIKNKK